MRKAYYLLLLFLIAGTAATAQVTIGVEAGKPHEFSLLELIADTYNAGGLRMPQFTTDERDVMTRTAAFQAEATGKAMGLTIFNTETKCLEYWNGEKWISRCSDNSCPPQEMPGVITFSNLGPFKLNEELTATVPLEPGVVYKWTLPPTFTAIGATNTNTIRIKPIIAGVHGLYNIGVTATNDCGNQSSWRAGTGFMEVYNCETAPQESDIDVNSIIATNFTAGTGALDDPYEIIEGYSFTLTYPDDIAPPAHYNWSLSTDGNKFFTIVSEGNNAVTLRANSQKLNAICDPDAVQIMAGNDCGHTNAIPSGLFIKIIPDPATCPQPATPSAITFSHSALFVGESFAASVTNDPDMTYNWTIPPGFVVEEPRTSSQITISTTVIGSTQLSAFSVTASNNCGRTSEAMVGTGTLVVNDYTVLQTGTGAIIGKKCFDIATGNNNVNYCATVSKRQPRLTNFADRTPQNPAAGAVSAPYTGVQVYTFKPLTGTTVSNVRFMVQDANTPKAVDSYTQNDKALTINFNPQLNTLLSGKPRTESVKVNINVIYTDNADGKDKKLETTLRLQDCACCGAATQGGGWLNFRCYNMGVDTNPDPFNYSKAIIGDAYQWGRRGDGHQKRSSQGVPGVARNNELDADGQVQGSKYGLFINSSSGYNNDWCSPQNDNLWQDNVKTKADPCPAGWRVPTRAQWASVIASGVNSINLDMQGSAVKGLRIGDFLYLPSVTNRMLNSYDPNEESIRGGEYWTSTPEKNKTPKTSNILRFTLNGPRADDDDGIAYRAQGRAVRCVEE